MNFSGAMVLDFSFSLIKLSTHFRIGLEEFLCSIFLIWTSNGSLYIWRSGDWEGTIFVSDVNASGSRRYV